MSASIRPLSSLDIITSMQVQTDNPVTKNEGDQGHKNRLRIYFNRVFKSVRFWASTSIWINLDAKIEIKHIFYPLLMVMIVLLINAFTIFGPKPAMKDYQTSLPSSFITILIFSALYFYMLEYDWILFMEEKGKSTYKRPFMRLLVFFVVWYLTTTTQIILLCQEMIEQPDEIILLTPFFPLWPMTLLFLWFQLPSSKRSNTEFRKRYLWFTVYQIAWTTAFSMFRILEGVTKIIPDYYQPVMGFVWPIFRFGFAKFLNMIAKNANCEGNESKTKFAVATRVVAVHSLWIVILAGTSFNMLSH